MSAPRWPIVEATTERLSRILRDDPATERLVRNRWIRLACLDPESGSLSEWRPEGFVRHAPETTLPIVVGQSSDWYQGKRGFLPPAAIVPAASLPA